LGDSTIEIPAQLVTLAPNLFVREGLEPRGEKKGKSVEITNKASSSLPESQGNRLASTSEAPTAKSEKTDAIFVEKLNKRIIEDGEEPVVVNGRLIKGGVKSLIVSTQSPVTKGYTIS
jgi:hypothetical protein